MLYSIDNMLGVLCTVYHGNICIYSSLLNMNSAGLVQGILRTGIMKNLPGTWELPPIVRSVVLSFLFVSIGGRRENIFAVFSQSKGKILNTLGSFLIILPQSEIRAGTGTKSKGDWGARSWRWIQLRIPVFVDPLA